MSSIAFAAIAAVTVTGAVLYPGFKTADVDLNDGGVWVTNTSQNLVGHLNYQSKVLDGGFLANSAGFDVLQDAGTVFMKNADQATLNPVDVAKVTLGSEQRIPNDAEVSLGSDTMSVTNPRTGEVWVTTAGSMGSFSLENTDPVLEGSPGTSATVGGQDTVYIADVAAGEIIEAGVDEAGSVTETDASAAEEITAMSDAQIAVVGDQPVVFDSDTGLLRLPSGEMVEVPDAADARLQQSGPESDFVAVATGLIKQPLDGSEATTVPLESEGAPAQPVQLGGCVHAAWAGAGIYLRDCAGNGQDKRTVIEQLSTKATIEFRVNRDDIIPPPDKSDEEEEESADDNPVDTLPDRTKENRDPVAEDDTYGVRAGRTTLLPVLDNDSDPDGDLLTVDLAADGPDLGKLQRIYDGTGMQIVVPEDATSGTHSFSYQADDGRGGTDRATVTLVVRGPGSNEPPERKRETRILLEQGKTVSQNVLSDWIDPDGDDLFLTAAEATTKGDQVRFRPDGRLTFQDIGTTFGEKEVKITVSDGRSSTEGTVLIDVRPPGAIPPVANPDHVSTPANTEVLIAPLKNDVDPNGGSLRLARVDLESNIRFDANYEAGTLTVESDTPGTYYLKYLLTNDPASSTGLIRVDVKADTAEGAPVAVRDVALLSSEGDALVDVLANDSDPNGGVLVVQSVDVPQDTGLNVAILNHNILRITDSQGLEDNVAIGYTVSNGRSAATGEVSVIPVPPRVTQECASTTCTITGLTNDTIYRFQVTATNEVGTSDPSPQSAEARPDAKPEQPAPPQLKFGDGELDVTWKTPPTPGSPVHSFNLRISPAPPGGGAMKTGVTGNSLTWGGLQNGVSYKVQVQAINDAPDPSDWGSYSAAEIPAGKPAAPRAPSTQQLQSLGGKSQVQVNWNAPSGNGDPVKDYTLTVLRGGAVQRTIDGIAGISQAVTVPNAEADYTFTVSATNKAGTSAQSAPSAPRRAFGKPGTVSNVSASPANTGGAGRAITVTFNELTAAQRNGAKASEARYRASFSDERTMGITSGQTVGSFSNGIRHSVRITAISSSDGASYTSPPSKAASAAPYGAPGKPGASATNGSEGETSITVGWSSPNRNTHDVANIQIRIDGSGWSNAPFSGSRSVGNGYDQRPTIKVRSCNSKNNCGPVAKASGRTGSKPPPPNPIPGRPEW